MTNTRPASDEVPQFNSNDALTLREAASVLNVTPDTMKDRHKKGRYPNAWQLKSGLRTWYVPISDLVASGDLDPSQVIEVASTLEAARESKVVAQLRAEIVDHKTQAARHKVEIEMLRTIAQERLGEIAFLRSFVAAGGAA